jgi:hypothetical protein
VGVLKFPNLGFLRLWGPIIFSAGLWLIWGLKQSCSPCWELFNGMWHATCTQGHWDDSWLSMVGSQIWLPAFLLATTYVSNVQMDHAIPLQTPTFQELSNDIRNASIQWVLTPTIALWKFMSPSGFQLPTWEFTWECESSFPHILYTLGSMNATFGLSLGPHSYKPLPWSRAQG